MELPKNITQIGEVGRDCKVYAEDYVVSYLKQLNGPAGEKQIAAALYGKRRTENGVTYYFLYGACRLDMLQTEVRHLSQAQLQEIERLRVRFFPEQEFLGYRILNGEMIEGFHIREQEICRYIPGYAQFYEKNDGMLAYMLSVRDEAQPEQFDQTKYDEVRRRQEERRMASEQTSRAGRKRKNAPRRMPRTSHAWYLKTAAAGVFVLLCLLGLVSLEDGVSADTILQTAGETLNRITEGEILTMEPKLDAALLEENQADSDSAEAVSEQPQTAAAESSEAVETAETPEVGTELANGSAAEAVTTPESETPTPETVAEEIAETVTETAETTAETAETAETTAESAPAAAETAAVAYVIRDGDTLSAISLRQYGSEKRVAELCEYNGISDPDDIKEGQVILLPQ